MDQSKDKNFWIYITISFVVGLLIGACLTLLFLPDPVCDCDELEIVDENEKELVLGVVEEKTQNEEESDTFGVSVSLPVSQCQVTVDIAGAVKSPGVYCFEEGSTIIDAVNHAKGFVEGVAYKFVSMQMNLSSSLSNHQKVYIPFEEDVYCEIKSLQYIDQIENIVGTTNNDGTDSNNSDVCININTATKEQLMGLDGVGESTAQKIIDARPFSETSDILNVSGIGEATYEKFKDDICV